MFKTWVYPGNGAQEGQGGVWGRDENKRQEGECELRQFPTLCVIISPIIISSGGLLAFRRKEVNNQISARQQGSGLMFGLRNILLPGTWGDTR